MGFQHDVSQFLNGTSSVSLENFLPQLHIMVNFSGSCLSFQCAMNSLNELNGLMPHASTGHGVG